MSPLLTPAWLYLTGILGLPLALALIAVLSTREIVCAAANGRFLRWGASLTTASIPLLLIFIVTVAQKVLQAAVLAVPVLYSR